MSKSKPSRDPYDRITDDMLRRPLRMLSGPQRAMVRAVIAGPRSEEFMARVKAFHKQ